MLWEFVVFAVPTAVDIYFYIASKYCFKYDNWIAAFVTLMLTYSVANKKTHTHIYIQGIHKKMVRFQKLTWNLFLTLHG
jgi:hypothetical protein